MVSNRKQWQSSSSATGVSLNDSTSSSTSRRIAGGFLAVAVVGVIGVSLWVLNNGQYLKTQVTGPTAEQEGEALTGEETVDDYTVLETYCEDARQGHILECGYAAPEDDYRCRTEGAQAVFAECLENTDPQEARVALIGEKLAALDVTDPEYDSKREALIEELEEARGEAGTGTDPAAGINPEFDDSFLNFNPDNLL